jgi:hypothetical protein
MGQGPHQLQESRAALCCLSHAPDIAATTTPETAEPLANYIQGETLRPIMAITTAAIIPRMVTTMA